MSELANGVETDGDKVAEARSFSVKDMVLVDFIAHLPKQD